MSIDEKKLPFYLLLRLEKYLVAKNQQLCYENSFRREFKESLEAAWDNKELTAEEYNYLKENYLEEAGVPVSALQECSEKRHSLEEQQPLEVVPTPQTQLDSKEVKDAQTPTCTAAAEVLTPEKRAARYELARLSPETYARIIRFTTDRDWDQFHTPGNLAKSISIEANELLECFQWSDTDYKLDKVKEELADVLVYCVDMLDKLNLSADQLIREKMDRNEAKYPVEKAKGSAKKYDEL